MDECEPTERDKVVKFDRPEFTVLCPICVFHP